MLVGQEHHLPGNTQDKVSPWADLTKFVTEKCIRVRRVFCCSSSPSSHDTELWRGQVSQGRVTRTSLVTCLWLGWLNFPPASLVTSPCQPSYYWPGLISWLTQDQNNQLQHIVCKPFWANEAKIEFKLDSMSSNHRGYRLPWRLHTEECSRVSSNTEAEEATNATTNHSDI